MLVLPYHPAIRPIEAPKGFDGTYYPWEDERIPKRLAIIKTNQRMVDTCDYLIAYAWHFLGGSGRPQARSEGIDPCDQSGHKAQ